MAVDGHGRAMTNKMPARHIFQDAPFSEEQLDLSLLCLNRSFVTLVFLKEPKRAVTLWQTRSSSAQNETFSIRSNCANAHTKSSCHHRKPFGRGLNPLLIQWK